MDDVVQSNIMYVRSVLQWWDVTVKTDIWL